IWKMNTGQYDYLINKDFYRYPGMKHVDLDTLSGQLENGTPCTASGVIQLQDSGVEVQLPNISHASHISISLDHNDRYQLQYLSGEREIATQNISTAYLPEPGGLMRRELTVPARAVSLGYDRLRIFPLSGEAEYCLGEIRLANP
ncbi:MAG: hypothetical protein WHV66_04660, partial [Anaerolineales bacterium]